MMDRKTRNQVVEMLLAVQKGISFIRVSQKTAMFAACISAVDSIAAVCREHFSAERYAVYAEVFDGMRAALGSSSEEVLTAGQLDELCDLYIELLDFSIKELRREKEIKKEILFLPYKASMWDSMESIWQAAVEDRERCNAYVMPIPYCDRNADMTVKEWHCEIGLFPKSVPTIDYQSVDIEKMHPDVIFIHNPYDGGNLVTSVDAHYYSNVLKNYTDLLMYVPYYATAGGMGEGQSSCPAYFNVDYIVVQSEPVCKLFDPSVPTEKLLPLGSPKFDRVVYACAHPPAVPVEWKSHMQGKTVYFYNTSLSGMLADTKRFLQKMEYVFQCFRGQSEACLLWRPHPLLASTFSSMRPEYLAEFERLKKLFIDERLGIYDATPDVDKTIALSDVYIGDTGTSITSLFGLAGKPLFYMNNNISSLPQAGDWRGELLQGFPVAGADEWLVTKHNQLYHAADGHHYGYVCNLSTYSSEFYYQTVIPFEERLYICPLQARDILVLEDGQIVKRIPLKYETAQPGAFAGAWRIGPYIFLLPFRYPAVVRCDMRTDQVDYVTGYTGFFVRNIQGEWRIGGSCVWKDKLLLASPEDAQLLALDSESLEVQELPLPIDGYGGSMALAVDGDTVWMLPYSGPAIISWNPVTGEKKVYSGWPAGFICRQFPQEFPCGERPFSMAAFTEDKAILSPCWGNMFVSLDKQTGKAEKWESPVEVLPEEKNGYYLMYGRGGFLRSMGGDVYRFFDASQRRLYDIDVKTKEYEEVLLEFQTEELVQHEPGFAEITEWLPYGCEETAMNSLPDLLRGTLSGQSFDRERQLRAFQRINANPDGTSGRAIYEFTMEQLAKGGHDHG